MTPERLAEVWVDAQCRVMMEQGLLHRSPPWRDLREEIQFAFVEVAEDVLDTMVREDRQRVVEDEEDG